MSWKSNLNKLVVVYLSNCRVTLSGEVNIISKEINRSLLTDEIIYADMLKIANEITAVMPFLKAEVTKELHQISIKIFAYNRLCDEETFLESIRFEIQKVVNKISAPDLAVRVNLSGLLKSWQTISKFMLISQRSEVEYKVTESNQTNVIKQSVGKCASRLLVKLRCSNVAE